MGDEMKFVFMMIAVISVYSLAGMAFAEGKGSIYISSMGAGNKWGINTGVTKESIFTFQVDDMEPVTVTIDKDAHLKDLDTDRKHLMKVYLDGKLRESFWFRFSSFQCDRLWLYFKSLYGTWILRESSNNCRR